MQFFCFNCSEIKLPVLPVLVYVTQVCVVVNVQKTVDTAESHIRIHWLGVIVLVCRCEGTGDAHVRSSLSRS